MLEYPEVKTIARQAQEHIVGKTIQSAEFLSPERKFVFCANSVEDFHKRLEGRSIERMHSYGNHLFFITEGDMALNIGDTGGKLLYHTEDKTIPKKKDILITFTDGTTLTHSVAMWGFIGAQTPDEMAKSLKHMQDEAIEPIRETSSLDHFLAFVADYEDAVRTSSKKFIISRKYFTGLGNGYVQDILWHAAIHPRRKMNTLTEDELGRFFESFLLVSEKATAAGGRTTERDLFNQPGGYEPILYRKTLGEPCTKCGAHIEKFSFEGGACYICPTCQSL